MFKGSILYIGGFELPDKNAAAHRVLNNAKLIRELGYEVFFVSVDKELPFNSSVMNTQKLIDGFPSWFIPYPDTNAQWVHYLSNITDFVGIAAQCPNLKAVICYNYQAVAFGKIMRYCRQNNIKIMADCTEWYSTKGSSFPYKILKGLDSFVRMRVIHKRVDGLMVISKYLENYYIKNKNLVRIPPLVDMEEEKWRTDSVGQGGPVKFVYAGSPGSKQKDKLDWLIKAFYELEAHLDFLFVIIGISRDKHLQYHSEQASLLDALGEKVLFLGRLSHTESLEQVKGADFTIFIREDTRVNNAGFPTKFVESISCGVPVITNKISNLSDYLSAGENGFWLEGNISATLKMVLNLDYHQLQVMKQRVERLTYDYRAYRSEVAAWLES